MKTKPTDELPQVLFIEDLARLLRCSRATIMRRLAEGSFPLVPLDPVDRRLRWSRDQVLEWLHRGPPARVKRMVGYSVSRRR